MWWGHWRASGMGANLNSSSHGCKGAFCTSWEERQAQTLWKEPWLGVGQLGFCHSPVTDFVPGFPSSGDEDAYLTQSEGDTCVQSVLRPAMVSNACKFSCPPRAWPAAGWGYVQPETVLSLMEAQGWCMVGDTWFSGMWCCLPSFLAGQGWGTKGFLPLVCLCVQWSGGRVPKFSG